MKILYVEDEPLIRGTFRDIFEAFQHTVITASDGLEALGMIESGGNYDLLVTDFEMPRMDGHDLIMTITKRRLRLRMILTSALPDDELSAIAQELGVEYIPKPWHAGQLIALVNGTQLAEQPGS